MVCFDSVGESSHRIERFTVYANTTQVRTGGGDALPPQKNCTYFEDKLLLIGKF